MISYLISFSLCSGLFLLFYRLLLSHRHMFGFNRFYLLGSLVFSLVVPAVSIPAWRQPAPVTAVEHQLVYQSDGFTADAVSAGLHPIIVPVKQFNWLQAAQIIYLLVAGGLLLRFGINLVRITHKILKADVVKENRYRLVLTAHPVQPHSFFNYIFLCRYDYEAGTIPAEVLCHEQAHAGQLHTTDVLFIELMQALCWFNLFIPLYRQAIRLNHEYMADDAVINHDHDMVSYQRLILAMSGGMQAKTLALSSTFNYQTIKNRLIMMTKTTSHRMAFCLQMAVIPVAAAALMLFSQKAAAKIVSPHVFTDTVKAKKIQPSLVVHALTGGTTATMPWSIPEDMRTQYSTTDASASVMEEYASILNKYNLSSTSGNTKDISVDDKALLHQLFIQMSKSQQNAQWVRFLRPFKPISKNTVSNHQLQLWQANAKAYGVWVDGKRIKNANLANYTANDFDVMQFSRLMPVAVKNDGFNFQVNLMTKTYYAAYYKRTLSVKEDRLMHIRHVERKD